MRKPYRPDFLESSPGHKSIEDTEIVDDIAKIGVRMSSENVINIGRLMHCPYDDQGKSLARKIKTPNDIGT